MSSLAYVFVWLVVFVAPWEMLGQLGPLPTLSRLLGLSAAGFAVLAILMGTKIRPWPRPLLWMIAYWAWSVLSMAWSIEPSATYTHIFSVTQLFMLVLLIWQCAPTVKQQTGLMFALLIGSLVPLAMMYTTYRETLGAEEFDSARFAGAGHDANYLAEMFTIEILMVVYLGLRPERSSWQRYFWWAYVVVAAFAVFLTGSRTGAVTLGLAGLWTLWFARTLRPQMKVLLIGSAVLIMVVLPQFVPSGLLTRIGELTSSPHTLEMRLDAWKRGVEVFLGNPILGVGGASFAEAITRLGAERRMVAHNIFITVVTEKGVIGLGILLTFLVMLWRRASSMPRRERTLWRGVLIVWLVSSMMAGSMTDKLSWFIFGIVLAQAEALRSAAARIGGKGAAAVRLPLRPRPKLRGAHE